MHTIPSVQDQPILVMAPTARQRAVRPRLRWDRHPLSGYAVVFVPFRDGKPAGKPETVVDDLVSGDEHALKGTPVGFAQDANGGLLIADDVGNKVWRVSSQTSSGG
ncbi:MAG: hypothetical protein JO369_09125 [Paucibacter sp.]|nr:hypothetical protein [Roseateles sp.]